MIASAIKLRPYQNELIYDKLIPWLKANKGNPIVSACVSAGKSIMIAELCRHAARDYGKKIRILMLVPTMELVEQNFEAMVSLKTDLNIGIISASFGRKDHPQGKDVIIATIGSVIKHPDRLGTINIIIVDEAHLINNRAAGQYRELAKILHRFNPKLRVIGWTGTPFRGNGVWLHDGEAPLFHGVAGEITIRQLLDQDYLSPLVIANTRTQVDSAGLKMVGDDYRTADIIERVDREEITDKITDEIIELGANRKKWLIFAASIEHAQHIHDALKKKGAIGECLTTKSDGRKVIIERFRRGDIRYLVNVAILTTGFNVPDVDMLVLARNTNSKILYVQIAGRGMRKANGKTDTLWVDFTDTTSRLGPVDLITGKNQPPKMAKSGGKKTCKICGSKNDNFARICQVCGAEFEFDDHINGSASQAEILSSKKIVEYSINDVVYSKHISKAGNECIRADYYSGIGRVHSEYKMPYLESTSKWLSARGMRADAFRLIFESDAESLKFITHVKIPKSIKIDESGKYTKLVEEIFDGNT